MIPGSANALLLSSAADTGYNIERSLRFNSADSAYLSRTPASAGNRKTWTWAGWVKRSGLGSLQYLLDSRLSAGRSGGIRFEDNGSLYIFEWSGSPPALFEVQTTQLLRDASAWYHIVLAVDTTQATASNRLKLYINGSQVTAFSVASYPSLNADTNINATVAHNIGREVDGANRYFNGYLADIHFIDGQALDPTSFGEFDATTGVWVPKAYTGTYGTNGFKLEFADNASTTTIGYDAAGSNDWTANNLSVTAGAGNDSLVDVPTNGAQTDTGAGGEVRGNYATLNPLNKATNVTLSDGNLRGDQGSSIPVVAQSTIGMSSGKWYCEFVQTAASAGSLMFGLNRNIDVPNTQGNPYYAYFGGGQKFTASSGTAYGATWGTNDVIGVGFDADNGTLTFYKNGVSQGTAFTGLTTDGPYFFAAGANGATFTYVANFGQRPFAYTAPSGFKALNTANLPAPLVTKPSDLFDVKLYTGNGSTQTISGLGFSPDLVWIKNRAAADSHKLTDTVRGATEELESDTTAAEATNADGLTQFNADGFDLGDDDEYNTNTESYVAWAWDAGTTTASNTDGSISSQVRANASAGFSIVKFNTGTSSPFTVGHGLGVKPALIIDKATGAGGAWSVYHSALGATKFLRLNTTDAADTQAYPWNNTEPTSTVFTGGDLGWWGASFDHIAYCFAPVAGYSSFGSYTGNGSADGPFVYTGFRPRWVITKRTDSTSNWFILDAARDPYNVVFKRIGADLSDAEGAAGDALPMDFTANGFKIRTANTAWNASGGTYIYAAFAEHPFQFSRAR
jgi:hypothetical protein